MTKVSMTVNGRAVSAEAEGRTLLVSYLREGLGLTGTHVGCDTSQCGACTVHVDGESVKSCTVLAMQAQGSEVTTIEGMEGPEITAVQAAWEAIDVPQCGWCQSGQMMAATALLEQTPKPTEQQITDGMTSNICRCATYHRIRGAVARASEIMG